LKDTELAQDIAFLLARARAKTGHYAHDALSKLGLRTRSYAVLALACSGKNPSQRELSEFLSLDPSQIVTLVDELEGRGLVARQTDPRDRRSKIITSTDSGQSLYVHAAAAADLAECAATGELGDDERLLLRELLRRVAF
jgi:DNA-binding MarR family transcriptional regulator